MNQAIRRFCLACALAGASQLTTMPAAMAEILNLKCTNVPNAVVWLVYWIDFERATITYASANANGIVAPANTSRVTITQDAFNFESSMGHVTVNRTTGESVWPMQTPYLCAKGTLPLPTAPARKF
jgi:hypothetical protein